MGESQKKKKEIPLKWHHLFFGLRLVEGKICYRILLSTSHIDYVFCFRYCFVGYILDFILMQKYF